MKLVACSSCHSQYDVTSVSDVTFKCHCGESVENRLLKGIDAIILRCGSCGAAVRENAKECEYCQSAIIREAGKLSLICPECYARNPENTRYCTGCGVEFHPQTVPDEGELLPCPVCTTSMPPHQIGVVGVNECPDCNGVWVPSENFDTLINRAIDARRKIEELGHQLPKTSVTSQSAFSTKVVYRNCPKCEKHMARRNFRQRSGVIVDSCPEHGTWLDANEIGQIANYIVSGGKPGGDHVSHVSGESGKVDIPYTENTEKHLTRMREQRDLLRNRSRGSLLQFFNTLLS